MYQSRQRTTTSGDADRGLRGLTDRSRADSPIEPGRAIQPATIGNLVPAYGEMLGGVSAVVEYAVSALKVKHVVACGHTTAER